MLVAASFGSRLFCRVVLIVVDRPADVILPAGDLLALLLRQVAVVRCAIVCHLTINVSLAALDIARLPRRHLAGAYAIGDAILLVGRAIVYRGHGRCLRASVIDGGKLAAVPARCFAVADLAGRRRDSALAHRGLLLRIGASVDAALAAVVAYAVIVVHHDSPVIDVVDTRYVDVIHAAVVGEGAMIPVAAFITAARVPEAVVHAAVEADVRPPVTGVEDVGAAAPSPVPGSP